MKTKTIITLSLLFTTLVSISSCKHEPTIIPVVPTTNNEGTGNGNGNGGGGSIIINTCDSDTVYFQNTILPLFVSNCAKSGCHDAISHKEGIILNSYSSIMSTGQIHAYYPGGSSYNSMITSDPGDRMPPPPSPAMTSAQINLITTWINQGALNNSCDCGCDTTNVTYSGTIVPMFQGSCNGCHNSTSTGGNINLTTYAGVQAVALNGHLYGSVNHDAGFSAMPKYMSKLPDCQIAEIRIWIQNGAPNN